MSKNKKVYELEMKILRNSKSMNTTAASDSSSLKYRQKLDE